MAEIDNRAFNYMKEGSPDEVAGGAIAFDSEHQTMATSKFEDEMNPSEQEMFLSQNAQMFKNAYDTDPNVNSDKLSYKSYLENLRPYLIISRADVYDSVVETDGESADPYLLVAKSISEHSRSHYGDVNRLIDMALGKGYDLY